MIGAMKAKERHNKLRVGGPCRHKRLSQGNPNARRCSRLPSFFGAYKTVFVISGMGKFRKSRTSDFRRRSRGGPQRAPCRRGMPTGPGVDPSAGNEAPPHNDLSEIPKCAPLPGSRKFWHSLPTVALAREAAVCLGAPSINSDVSRDASRTHSRQILCDECVFSGTEAPFIAQIPTRAWV